jgi:hypothetical protein
MLQYPLYINLLWLSGEHFKKPGTEIAKRGRGD